MTVAVPTFDLVVAANRLPVERVVDASGGGTWQRSPGGLVTALESVMRGRKGAWVGWAGEPGAAPEPFDEDGMHLHPVALSPVEIQEYYEGFSNDTLWPIYHDVIVPATFHRNWWNTYRTVNHRFAQAVAEVAAPGATVWVHDYQLQLVPGDGAGDPTRCAHRLVQPHPVPAGRALRPAARGAGPWWRVCWARTSWASSAPPTPRTSCAAAAGCWAWRPRATR